jgi:hypothetical protein
MELMGGVVWYAIGRFYEAQDGTFQDLGYLAHLGGISPLFREAPGEVPNEGAAFFTFRSEPFRVQTFQNGDLSLSLDPKGRFTLYLNRDPRGDFNHPDTFSHGEPIATFQRLSSVVGTSVGPVSTNLFSAELVSSKTFFFQGKSWNLRNFIPQGITQMGTGSTTALTPPPGFTKTTAFVGSALVLGGPPR